MNMMAITPQDTNDVQVRYQDNFPRYVLGVSRYLQTSVMNTLHQSGYSDLRVGFEPYIALIGGVSIRLSDIAAVLGVTRQAANQTANQIEKAGYIKRLPDPQDGRAKQLVLTKQGQKLRDDGARVVAELQQEMADIVGLAAMENLIEIVDRLCSSLTLRTTAPAFLAKMNTQLAGRLPRLGDYIESRLMTLTKAKGHDGLKRSFSQFFLMIGPNGGRIQHIAEMQGVSKQAVGVIANELEDLGYLWRDADPEDARQVLPKYTDKGFNLLRDSIVSIELLEKELTGHIDDSDMIVLRDTMHSLYHTLHLEEDIFKNTGPIDIRAYAQQLKTQLGQEGAQFLGRLLLSSDDI